MVPYHNSKDRISLDQTLLAREALGWLAPVFAVSRTGPIDPWIPLIMFTITFSLSMGYEVFLLSRVRGEWRRSGDPGTAVADGITATGRIITAAAAIMICVFRSFVIGDPLPILDVFGLGMAVAILIDATVVRMVLAPSIMQLLGQANWWLPRWLDRAIPRLEVETETASPDRVRGLVLLGPMGIASWRSTLKVLGPLLSLTLRPTDAKRDKMMTCGLGEGDRVNREAGPWLMIAGKCAGKGGWPFKISARRLQMIQAPALLFLAGKDDVVGSARAAARRARRTIAACQIEILPDAGHLMMFDEPEAIGARIAGFLQADRS